MLTKKEQNLSSNPKQHHSTCSVSTDYLLVKFVKKEQIEMLCWINMRLICVNYQINNRNSSRKKYLIFKRILKILVISLNMLD